ncbi:primosomal protein N' (replication factor Y) priA [Candidatus Kinetoplastibacterium blastocrithidii TCC012E]|uniref:Replication restart protein PriA n=1 Tax=Candidatus Kinetoplastidibacterium blastocrithidiae TCC012E TaxID=1208922 RepID=M1M2T6_9PROT|nr:primosomal protein N' [Candidatus Kinetoplastibacterium blastocrithidii]AFZ83413.1 primosomal protein N' [Candidatus Kinetoplastibacterium blastocrithidii (ex Strigomonas culicis)]AGF49509.1 primosomal protein N' (replication factor Y) priA [Candidatus Kinetoplastibacterium blastocrithidii TCC012E]
MPSQSELLISYNWLCVALNLPLFSTFDYKSTGSIAIGSRVIVPFGKRTLIGIVINVLEKPSIDASQVREILNVLDDLPPFLPDWLRLLEFTADYYQRPLGEVMFSVIPSPLRDISSYKGECSLGGPTIKLKKKNNCVPSVSILSRMDTFDAILNEEQKKAIDIINSLKEFKAVLLYGITGSGKTEVYLRAARNVLQNSSKQILFLIPEINLTPQLEKVVRNNLVGIVSDEDILVMHSKLTMSSKLDVWSRAQNSKFRVLLGTRMSVFVPFSNIGLIVVDEEHDTSYKQQNGLRYSARDLGVWRARYLNIPIILGSATPALETWNNAETGHYLRIYLKRKAMEFNVPDIKLINTKKFRPKNGLTAPLIEAIEDRLKKKEQSLIFINRRGYSPVFCCFSCDWVSKCPRCTAFTVLHSVSDNQTGKLHCHHCGYYMVAPLSCPECGDQDLRPVGSGTQRIEEALIELFPNANIIRIDADSTKRKGSIASLLNDVNNGVVDILIGTQMLAKGHDFLRVSLVGVINSDAMIFCQDFRAPEHLFSQLIQVSGRAGRHLNGGEVLIQTSFPEHMIYKFVIDQDYESFAKYLLNLRSIANLPPYSYQALLSVESKNLNAAMDFLYKSREIIKKKVSIDFDYLSFITCYDPVPSRIVRIADVERAQILVESKHRSLLITFLKVWLRHIRALVSKKNKVKWHIDVDPLEI